MVRTLAKTTSRIRSETEMKMLGSVRACPNQLLETTGTPPVWPSRSEALREIGIRAGSGEKAE